MLRVAARFGVSASYIARVCTLLNVPRPESSYWAKLAVGKAPKQPTLPEPRPGDPLEWTRDGALPKRARPLPKPPDKRPGRKRTVRRQLQDQHTLVSGSEPLFEAGRLSWHGNHLKPAKKRLVEEGERQAEIERQRWEDQREHWRRKDEEQRAAKALEEEELLQVIDAWTEVKRFEAFFADAERRAQDLPDEQRERTIAPSTGARSDRQHRCA